MTGARIRSGLHMLVGCRGSPLEEFTSSSRYQNERAGRAASLNYIKTEVSLSASTDDRAGRAASPKAPMYVRGTSAMFCFGIGGVELKPKHVRKSPMNEILFALCGEFLLRVGNCRKVGNFEPTQLAA